MFGRGLDEKKRKKRIRRVGGGGRKVKADGTTTAAKVKIFPSFYISKFPITYFIWQSDRSHKDSWVPSLSH